MGETVNHRISPGYRTIVVDGVFGGLNQGGTTLKVYRVEDDPNRYFGGGEGGSPIPTVECELVIAPLTMKILSQTLGAYVEGYEKNFGEIKLPDSEGKPAEGEGK